MTTWTMFLSEFAKNLGHWLSILSIIATGVSFFFGVVPSMSIVPSWVWMLIFAVSVLVLAINASKRTVDAIAAKMAEDFYSVNPNARREQGHYMFYRLSSRGEALLRGESISAQVWQAWDREVRVTITHRCMPIVLQMYLANTGRLDSSHTNDSLAADRYQSAVQFIRSDVLDWRLSDVFR